jgi:hypothetical protein
MLSVLCVPFIFLAPRLNPLSLGTIVHLTGQADFTDYTDAFLCSGIRDSVFAYGYAGKRDALKFLSFDS